MNEAENLTSSQNNGNTVVVGSTVKTFNVVQSESTCQKRVTVCEIYNKEGLILARESNRCSPSGGTCHRLSVIQNKDNYDKDSNCNWIHAEINTIRSLPKDSEPYKAIIYGHTFFCDNCEQALRRIGIVEFEVR